MRYPEGRDTESLSLRNRLLKFGRGRCPGFQGHRDGDPLVRGFQGTVNLCPKVARRLLALKSCPTAISFIRDECIYGLPAAPHCTDSGGRRPSGIMNDLHPANEGPGLINAATRLVCASNFS